jgi:hypothetical protein
MHRPNRFADRHIVVADFKCSSKLVLAIQLRLRVRDRVRQAFAIRAPRELTDPVLAFGELQRVAAPHRHDEQLQDLAAIGRDKSDFIAARRPAW